MTMLMRHMRVLRHAPDAYAATLAGRYHIALAEMIEGHYKIASRAAYAIRADAARRDARQSAPYYAVTSAMLLPADNIAAHIGDALICAMQLIQPRATAPMRRAITPLRVMPRRANTQAAAEAYAALPQAIA